MADVGSVISSKNGPCAWLTFSNPKRLNAVSLRMWQAAETALGALGEDEEVRILVVTGAGERAFVAGSDMSRFESERSTKAEIHEYNETIERVFTRLAKFPAPTIAMIRGHCIGAGLHLALACDIRICSDRATFAMPAAARGLALSYDALKRMVASIGPTSAKEICFTAQRFDASAARSYGVVGQVMPHDDLTPYVNQLTDQIARNAPLVLKAMKHIIAQTASDGVHDRMACDSMVDRCFDSNDYIEGRRAAAEKRPPQFTGT